jgi:polysaccharide deacetylase family protein (PEP-CTERM system associated)
MKKRSSALSVDVEDGISIAMRDHFKKDMPPTERVVDNTNRLLDLFQRYGVKATFFTLGNVAEHYPALIRRMDAEGHEIGVHGYSHYQFFRMTPEQARDELSRAKSILEELTGKPVVGHRAPAFSINPQTAWALDLLVELGFEYDSSIMPIKTARYGWSGFNPDIHILQTPRGNSILEVPLSTVRVAGRGVPIGGGSYLRLFPLWFTRYSIRKVLQKRPAIVYLHPYEVDTQRYPDYYFAELNRAGLKKRLAMKSFWINRHTMAPKLEALIAAFSFTCIRDVIREVQQADAGKAATA